MNKTCSFCKQNKPLEGFFKNRKRKDGVQTYCKKCKLKKDHLYYEKNKERQRKRVQEYLLKNKRKLWEYLEGHPCKDCGEKNPIVLEFDHVNRNSKKGAVSFLLSYSKCSWGTILKEISKCEIRCANCHRMKTAKQLGWWKFMSR